MLDKLSLTSPRVLSLEEATNNLKGHFSHSKPSGTKYHQSVKSFHLGQGRKGQHVITLHTQPRYPSISPTKIEINPARFQSFRELKELLSLVVPCETLAVTRIDHCVDIPVSVDEIFNSLIYSRKKSREIFKDSKLTGFYLGAAPELLAVYDKGRKEGEPEIRTRLELRHFRDKVLYKSFEELPKYQDSQPFTALKFRRLVGDSSQSPREQAKRSVVADHIHAGGAQSMFKALNRNSNFKRDIEPILEPHPEIPDLNTIYQKNLKTFFNKENSNGL